LNKKGIITLEMILCVLIIIIVLGFFVNVNLGFKEKFEKSKNVKVVIEIIKEKYYQEEKWEKHEIKGASNST